MLKDIVTTRLGIKPYRKIEERYDRTALRTLIKTGLRTGTKAGTTGTVKALAIVASYVVECT